MQREQVEGHCKLERFSFERKNIEAFGSDRIVGAAGCQDLGVRRHGHGCGDGGDGAGGGGGEAAGVCAEWVARGASAGGPGAHAAHVPPHSHELPRHQARLRRRSAEMREGGCGACVVFLSRYNPRDKKLEELTINSCLTLLCSLDGCAITTTEGLGNQRSGHHAIHKRLSGFHASQCGFCTPGMTMALYGTMRKSITNTSNTNNNHKFEMTVAAAERAVAGNLCRCTGYRPILDACKSFCGEVDLEDLGLHQFDAEKNNELPHYDPASDPIFPQFLVQDLEANGSMSMTTSHHDDENGDTIVNGATNNHGSSLNGVHENGGTIGVHPRFQFAEGEGAGAQKRVWVDTKGGLAEVFGAMKSFQGTKEVKLVVGNTAAGYYKDIKPTVFIDISKVSELLDLNVQPNGIEVGAAVSISKFIEFLETLKPPKSTMTEASNPQELHSIPQVLASHLSKVATNHVRNWGSIGGNLIMAQKHGFQSDIATILLGVGAHVKIVTQSDGNKSFFVEEFPLEDFLAMGGLKSGMLLKSIWVPLDDETSHLVLFKTYRAAPRPLGNALALINAAFFVRVNKEEHGEVKLEGVRLAFGAFGTKHAIRAREVEQFLTENALTWKVALEAVRLLKKDVVPMSGTRKAEYRVSVAGSFLFDFLRPLLETTDSVQPTVVHANSMKKYEMLCTGKQVMTTTNEYFPVGQPAVKIASEIQASGEAIFVDDIPSPENCLHMAFVCSQEALAKIENVDVHAALKIPGTVAYISAANIPPAGKNIGINMAPAASQDLFATDLVECVGHPLGVMVADTYEHAKEAAGKVKVQYDTTSVGPPVLTAEDALSKGSLFPPHFFVAAIIKPTGDYAKGFAEGELKIENVQVYSNSQMHFYMEPQTVLAVPDEDNCMVVYCSTQSPEFVQTSVAGALGLPMHNIRVITRRVGGGFGGKVFRTTMIAVACALAAYKLQKPVRTALDRNTDMLLIGGRSPITSTFTAAFTKEGKITAVKIQMVVEAGYSPDFSTVIPGMFMQALKKYNYGALDVEFKICKTNTVPKTSMRAPGETQGSFVADTIIEQVAASLNLDSQIVRERNLHSHESMKKFYGEEKVGDLASYKLPSIWMHLKASANWVTREREVAEFNGKNIWLKRGLAMVPVIYGHMSMSKNAMVTVFPDGSIAVEVGGVEIGQGLHTKVRQAAAYALSKLWPEGRGVEASEIRIVQTDTISQGNGGTTANSTTSEVSCGAVQAACEILVERLTPLHQKLKAGAPGGQVPWKTLASRAFGVDLKAAATFTPKSSYFSYGAAASEVEINVLTGETQVLAADMVYDCGRSLNPAVDMGQIEGSFVQGMGFYMMEDVETINGKLVSDGTWTYKIPTVDTIPKRFHVELHNSPAQQERVLSSKAAGEAPLLLSGSVHCAIRKAIESARSNYNIWNSKGSKESQRNFRLDAPATMERIKSLCGFNNVELYMANLITKQEA